jgi:ribulose-phosphate 3-epimerase
VAEYSQWISAGAKRVIVHVEAFPDAAHLLQFVVKFKEEYGGDGSFLATGLGVAINIETDLAVLDPILEYVDFVQCMGIRNIGYQGNPFDNAVLERIRTLKQKKQELVISVDGGITVENAREIINAGAQRLIVGSAIFNSDDIPATIEEFENL